MLLLPNGDVMAQEDNDSGTYGPVWYLLTPNSNGSYVDGTWSTLASENDTRLFFSSDVLPDGDVFVAGGEYGTGGSTAEIYNPQTNVWTETPAPGNRFSDANSEVLSNGNILDELVQGNLKGTMLYDPMTNTWTTGPSSYGISNESAWVKLPDNSILMVNRLSTNAERYIPSLNEWVEDATVPVELYDSYGDEAGPGVLLPNGSVIYFGSTDTAAIYTPSGTTAPGTWTTAAAMPNGQGMPDAPTRDVARRQHPDRDGSDSDLWKRVSVANELLRIQLSHQQLHTSECSRRRPHRERQLVPTHLSRSARWHRAVVAIQQSALRLHARWDAAGLRQPRPSPALVPTATVRIR